MFPVMKRFLATPHPSSRTGCYVHFCVLAGMPGQATLSIGVVVSDH